MRKNNNSIYLYLFLVLVVAFIFIIDKDRNDKVEEVKEEVKVDNSIYEKESNTIKKLEKYIVPSEMFKDKLVTEEDLDDESKLKVVLSYFTSEGYFEDKTYYQVYDEEGNKLEKPKKISERKYNKERKDLITYKNLSDNKVGKTSQKIFNSVLSIPDTIEYKNITCKHDKELECSNIDTIQNKEYIKYVSSDIKDDEIHIYQKYLSEIKNENNRKLFDGQKEIDLEKNEIKEITDGILDKYGKTYKSTFKKDKNGHYYWYSTEPTI